MQSRKTLATMAVLSLLLLTVGISPAAAMLYEAGNDYNSYGHVIQTAVPDIGPSACCPTSAINSFTYLQNQFPSVYGNRLASNPPTIADVQTIAGPNYMNTDASGTTDPNGIWGRYLYLESRAPFQTHYSCQVAIQDGLPLEVDHIDSRGLWPLNRPYPTFMANSPGAVAVPTWQFLYENLQRQADVGVRITFITSDGSLAGAHCLTLNAFSFDDKNNNGIIEKEQGELGSVSFVDPESKTEVKCHVWQNTDQNFIGGYPYLLLDINNSLAVLKWAIAEYHEHQDIPAVAKAGTILVLSSNSPYDTLTFQGGVLYAVEPQTTWNKALILGNTGGMLDSGPNACTLTGTISGAGTLSKMGSGTLFLRGHNSYTGGTILSEGTVNVVRDENLGGPSGSLTFQGGTLQAGADLTLNRHVVCQRREGAINTFDTGTYTSIFTGTLEGWWGLTQTGQGTLIMRGDGSRLQEYTVSSSTLIVETTFGGRTRCSLGVEPQGILQGSGFIVGDVTNLGTVNPGTSVGTLNVEGRYDQDANGRLEVEVASPTNYDRLNLQGFSGLAVLDGALQPILLDGYRPPANTVFPGIITTERGVYQTFATIANNTPILTWQAIYSEKEVDLTLTRDYAKPSLGLNSNQHAVGTMFNGVADTTGGDLAMVLNSLDNLPTGSVVAAAYQQISPDQASALPALSLAGSRMQWQSLANRLSYQRWCQGDLPNLAGGRSGSFNLTYNRLAGLMLAYNGAELTGLLSAPRSPADRAGTWGLFTDFVSTFGSQDSTANVTGYTFTILGFTAGADYRLRDDLVIGLGTGYYHTSAAYQGSGGDAGISSIPFYAYGAYTPGSFYAMVYLGYTLNLYSLNRNIAFGGLSRVATGSPNGNQLNASLETGYDFKLAPFTVTPALSLYYSTAWVDSFTETGAGALNLNVASQSADSVQTGVGIRLSRPFVSGTTLLLPQIYAFYQHEFANNSRGLDARLGQAGTTFGFQTDSPSRNFAVLGAGLAVGLRQNLTLQATYNAEVGRDRYLHQVVSAGLRWEF
jgi:outer membrane autotransporter protein